MSAWVVSKDHVRLLAQAQALYSDEPAEDLDALCSMLMHENVESVNYRYNEHDTADPVKYEPVFGGEDPAAFKWLALKSIHCYQYQACEHPAWGGSEAKRLTDALEDQILARLPGVTRDNIYAQPEYDAQPWGFKC